MHAPIQQELLSDLSKIVESNAFVLGPAVEKFESQWARYCEAPHAVGVQSGTAALMCALAGVGVGRGDDVITTPATFVATVGAIHFLGANPVLVDIDDSYTMDPEKLQQAIAPNTRAVVPVHLYGQCADMDRINGICAAAGDVSVVEDASQAHGARYKGRRAGNLGQAGTFSFYPGKNLGALGEAGAVTTGDEKVARIARLFRSHGEIERYKHEIPGLNFRMPGFQGAALSVKLRSLDAWNDRRREIATRYSETLQQLPLGLPRVIDDQEHVYHQFVVRHPDRDALCSHLNALGVSTAIHYPEPVHLVPAYAHLGHKPGDFPVSEILSREGFSLPVHAQLSDDQVEYVINSVGSFFR